MNWFLKLACNASAYGDVREGPTDMTLADADMIEDYGIANALAGLSALYGLSAILMSLAFWGLLVGPVPVGRGSTEVLGSLIVGAVIFLFARRLIYRTLVRLGGHAGIAARLESQGLRLPSYKLFVIWIWAGTAIYLMSWGLCLMFNPL